MANRTLTSKQQCEDFVRGDIATLVNTNVAKWVEGGVLRLTPEAGTDGFTAQVLVVGPS